MGSDCHPLQYRVCCSGCLPGMPLPRVLRLLLWVFSLLAGLPSARTDEARDSVRVPFDEVLILSQGKGGGSFVGELLDHGHRVTYMHEPCRSLTLKHSKIADGASEEQCAGLVGRLISCNPTEEVGGLAVKNSDASNVASRASLRHIVRWCCRTWTPSRATGRPWSARRHG